MGFQTVAAFNLLKIESRRVWRVDANPVGKRIRMMNTMRGPYTIEQLASLCGVTVRTIRRYQQKGIIPRQREWAQGSDIPMYYKVDVDRIRASRRGQRIAAMT